MYLRYCLVELVNKSENDKYRDISAVQVAGLPLLRMAPSPNENPYEDSFASDDTGSEKRQAHCSFAGGVPNTNEWDRREN